MLAGQLEGLLEIGGADDLQHRAENLFLVAFHVGGCLLYTSDAADERSSVDLGGRRIIKKKTINDADRRTL